ncbi:hypothetical protein SLEP1_g16441 [Rubroshorea leprosula]|uniref:DUF7866 domain-containing protein n=1 Tax=Rubroshorea leprosula TaxID=152421 RepID=A0AAV5J047_9ROSI|nr:hypothetical protein SLEP1_g16441 [Rubroshorea leprosula]
MNSIMKPLVLLLFISQFILQVNLVRTESPTGEWKPVGPTEYRPLESNLDGDPRRRLAPFQLCLACKCCTASAAATCATLPCCFGIDCQLPNKPYGVCAFVPMSCNCTSCASV